MKPLSAGEIDQLIEDTKYASDFGEDLPMTKGTRALLFQLATEVKNLRTVLGTLVDRLDMVLVGDLIYEGALEAAQLALNPTETHSGTE